MIERVISEIVGEGIYRNITYIVIVAIGVVVSMSALLELLKPGEPRFIFTIVFFIVGIVGLLWFVYRIIWYFAR